MKNDLNSIDLPEEVFGCDILESEIEKVIRPYRKSMEGFDE